MTKQITIIQGYPDPKGNHFGHALANAYTQGAETAGHEVRHIDIAKLNFPILRTKEDGEHGQPSESIRQSQKQSAGPITW
jgi:putative NADPH-quinone reductase